MLKVLFRLYMSVFDRAWGNIPDPIKNLFRFAGYCITLIIIGFLVGFGQLLAFSLLADEARAESPIPRAAETYRPELIRSARFSWGLEAPVAVLAAQIEQESAWNPRAVSRAGAQGLAQFMPATAEWLPSVIPSIGEAAPLSPAWALRALPAYDKWLWDRISAADAYERMAFTLSAYNGGQGWVARDKRLAAQRGLDPDRWHNHVAEVNAGRSAPNWRENRAYPRRILARQDAYVRAGWGPGIKPSGARP